MDKSEGRATPEQYDELIKTVVAVIKELAQLKEEDPETFEERRAAGEFDFLGELGQKHPEIVGDVTSRLEFEELMEDPAFREQIEAGLEAVEKGDLVPLELPEDWDPED